MKPRFRAEVEAVMVVSGVKVTECSTSLASCCGEPMMRNSVLEEFRARRLAAIHAEAALKVDWRDEEASRKI